MFASIHVHPALTIPLACAVGWWMLWYWTRLGRVNVPPSRRKIRRTSLVFMLLALPMFVRALSVLDPAVRQREYVMTWSLALLMVMIVLFTALLDATNNLRLHQRSKHAAFVDAAHDLGAAIRDRRQSH